VNYLVVTETFITPVMVLKRVWKRKNRRVSRTWKGQCIENQSVHPREKFGSEIVTQDLGHFECNNSRKSALTIEDLDDSWTDE